MEGISLKYQTFDLVPKTLPLAVKYAIVEMQIGEAARALVPHFHALGGLMLVKR
jgi:hypothetical protein